MNDKRAGMFGAGIAIGLGIGAAIGIVLDNLAIGIAIGMGICIAFGAAFGAAGDGNPEQADGDSPTGDDAPGSLDDPAEPPRG